MSPAEAPNAITRAFAAAIDFSNSPAFTVAADRPSPKGLRDLPPLPPIDATLFSTPAKDLSNFFRSFSAFAVIISNSARNFSVATY